MLKRSDKPLRVVANSQSTTSQATNDADRRLDDRYPFTATAVVIELSSQMRVVGRSSDLGTGGCYVDTILPFAVGTTVCVRLDHQRRQLETLATVSYTHPSLGMGLTFKEIKPDDLAVLRIWLAELTGERLPSPPVPIPAAPASPAVPSANGIGVQSEISMLRQVLNELINMMIRKGIIDESEGVTLLRQLFR